MIYDDIPNSDKFTARGFEAAVIGYGPLASYEVVAIEDLKNVVTKGGRLTVTVTRDVRLNQGEFPARALNLTAEFKANFVKEDVSQGKCALYDKWIMPEDAPPTCEACCGRKSKHAEDPSCILQRCRCPKDKDDV